MSFAKSITLAFSGASGMPYGLRLLECLLAADVQVNFIVSQAAQVVAAMEMEIQLPGKIDGLEAFFAEHFNPKPGQLAIYGQQQWSAPIASGSALVDAMVICPCSSGCVSAIATGASNNLLERAADVMLKERRQLILVPRETPLSTVHLANMLTLSQMGATIMPASPGFYHKPERVEQLVDFMVARILDHLQIAHDLMPRWPNT